MSCGCRSEIADDSKSLNSVLSLSILVTKDLVIVLLSKLRPLNIILYDVSFGILT